MTSRVESGNLWPLDAGTVKNPLHFECWSHAFDFCRDLGRPITVSVVEVVDNKGQEGRIFPSGRFEGRRS
jgi:hypothetical protein